MSKTKNYNSPLNYWFEYLSNSPLTSKCRGIQSYYTVLNMNNLRSLFKIKTAKELYIYMADIKWIISKTIIKDPIAFMSVEWLYDKLDLEVIILIRHPNARCQFKVKIGINFNELLNQTELMNSYLKDYENILLEYSSEKSIIEQGILVWNIFMTSYIN